MRRLIGWLGPVVASLAFCTVANAQSRFQTYFLAVGSSAYIKPNAPNEHGFPNLGDMNRSARLVGDLLSRDGAVFGIVFTSTASLFVSRGDFESALSALGARVRSDHPAHPLVVVYLAGHGISEGIAWTHFSVPGNFVYGSPLERLDVDAVAQHTIYASGVADELDQLKVPYMLLLDSCYSGKAADFTSPFLSPTAIGNLRDVAAVLRFVNEFHQSNPVVFSTPPGTEVLPAEDPRDPLHSLGPIARRLLLLTREATATGKNFTLSATVGRLLAADLDGGTAPPISNATPSSLNSILTGGTITSRAAIEERQGSATTEDVCCGPGSVAASAALPHSYRLHGTLAFEGPPGEFVSNGRRISLPPATVVGVAESDAHSLELSFGGPESWELDLSVPEDRQIEPGRYTDAQRYPFQNAGLPGLAFSGDGRACNEVSGEFTVTGIQRAAGGRITNLTAAFSQACDGKPATLRGTVKLNAP
jgi:hypothetical protein